MQHTNDDIDELYRNAADNYPLKINGADWDSIAGRLAGGSDNAPVPVLPFATQKPGKNYRYLLLLLLLPAGFFAVKYAGKTGGGGNQTATQPAAKTSSVAATPTQPAATAPAAPTVSSNNSVVGNTPAAEVDNVKIAGNAGSTHPAVSVGKTGAKTMVVKTPAVISTASQPDAGNTTAIQTAVPPLNQLGAINKQNEATEKLNNLYTTSPSVTNNAPAQKAEEVVPNSSVNAVAPQPTVKDELIKHQAETSPAIAKTGEKGEGNVSEPVKKPTQKHLYVGAFVAPDYTTIKYQPGNKVGFDFGGLVGYTFTRNLSLEVGVSLDKKYYTSDGKYYNTANQKWIENAGKLLTLSGYSSLTEFPINVKYSFKPGRDGNFFVSGGLVSYVVHEENYDYEFDKSGYIYHKDKSTKKGTTNAFANFNISAGYESSLGHGINFRVEPYYRIPVKGIGLGGLPITSVGLNIGIIKKIR